MPGTWYYNHQNSANHPDKSIITLIDKSEKLPPARQSMIISVGFELTEVACLGALIPLVSPHFNDLTCDQLATCIQEHEPVGHIFS